MLSTPVYLHHQRPVERSKLGEISVCAARVLLQKVLSFSSRFEMGESIFFAAVRIDNPSERRSGSVLKQSQMKSFFKKLNIKKLFLWSLGFCYIKILLCLIIKGFQSVSLSAPILALRLTVC